MSEDPWSSASLAERFADQAYATVKGYVRTYVIHRQLLDHLPRPPAALLDVGGGAGHQSLPLAQAGYQVTLLDSSQPMLDKARARLTQLPDGVQHRVRLVHADGYHADEAVAGQRFAAVLCHGVLGYLEHPEQLIDQVCRCTAPSGIVSIMTGNAKASAIVPALERRWDDALAAFDTTTGEVPGLGVQGHADTVEDLSEQLRRRGVQPERWYGTWLFVDWLQFGGTNLDPADTREVAAIAAVELEASRRDPYRQLSRAFHLIARRRRAAR